MERSEIRQRGIHGTKRVRWRRVPRYVDSARNDLPRVNRGDWAIENLRLSAAGQRNKSERLNVEESLVDVGDDVVDVLDADGKADEAIGYADAVANFLGHRRVSHLRGQRDKRFDTSETFRQRADLHLVEEAARGFFGANIEGEHGAGAFLLTASDFMLRVSDKAGIVDFADLGMRIEMARDGEAVGVVL